MDKIKIELIEKGISKNRHFGTFKVKKYKGISPHGVPQDKLKVKFIPAGALLKQIKLLK